MSSPPSSSRFLAIYDLLPPDEQHALVEKHLVPLLDSASNLKAKKALSSATRVRDRHAGMPVLDLRAKKHEVGNLIMELSKDAKRSFVMDTSNKPELYEENIETLTSWLNDIWRVVYEHSVYFTLAHECLLFVVSTVDRIANIRSGCKCALTNMYIPITLRAKSGRRVKTFHITGAQHLDEVVEFIWREMFLSMLASGGGGHGDRIPGMLQDIERISGWRGVQRILYGGKRSLFDLGYDCETESEDYPDDEVVDDDDDDDFEDEGSDDEFDEPHHCRHWSSRVSNQMPQLQRLIESALIAVFEDTPSTSLYTALLSMSADTASTEERLLGLLKSIATVCSDTYAVALEIYAKQRKTDLILNLLDSHSHLLRSRDAHALQSAVLALSHRGHVQRATQILEAELLETSNAVRQSLLLSYSQLDDEHNRTEISSIIKLRSGAGDRRDRVETWVDNITTPGAETPNPLLFAAMMMGMPPMPGMSQDDDPYTYLDFDPLDPDLEDLRCEFRPGLKQRFESWVDIGLTLRTGPAVLLKVYKDIIDVMPFLRAPDATEEMINRLQDRVSKKYVCEGLDALLAFVKVQRRKWNTAKADLRRRKEAEKMTTSSSTPPNNAKHPNIFLGMSPFAVPSASTTPPPPKSQTEAQTSPVPADSPSTSAIPSFFDSFFRNSPSASSTPPLPAPASPPPATALSAFGFLFPGTQPEAGISGPTGGGVEDVD